MTPGLSPQAKAADCCYCREFLAGYVHNDIGCSRVIAETTHCVAFPSLGALADGHVLISPKRHWHSLAALPDDVLSDFLALRAGIAQHLEHLYGPCVQFEHGVVEGRGGGCGIDHAHLHLVPAPHGIHFRDILPSHLNLETLCSLGDMRERMSGNVPYIFVQDETGSFWARIDHLPSQYLRRRLACAIGHGKWDWRADPINRSFRRSCEALLCQG